MQPYYEAVPSKSNRHSKLQKQSQLRRKTSNCCSYRSITQVKPPPEIWSLSQQSSHRQRTHAAALFSKCKYRYKPEMFPFLGQTHEGQRGGEESTSRDSLLVFWCYLLVAGLSAPWVFGLHCKAWWEAWHLKAGVSSILCPPSSSCDCMPAIFASSLFLASFSARISLLLASSAVMAASLSASARLLCSSSCKKEVSDDCRRIVRQRPSFIQHSWLILKIWGKLTSHTSGPPA